MAILTISEFWPDIAKQDPLPEVGPGGYRGLLGFTAPFNAQIYEARFAEGLSMKYSCGGIFFWHGPMRSLTPWVPLYKNRILEMAESITPSLLRHSIACVADDASGKGIPPRGGHLVHLSPDEWSHAIVFKIADRIKAGTPDGEMDQWLRCLLSCPFTFMRVENEEAMFAECSSQRQDILSTAAAVTHSVRQMVHNIWGFKLKMEDNGKRQYGAQQIAQFWEKVRLSAGQKNLMKLGTIDTCLTIYKRLFSIPECETLLHESENRYGVDGPWSSIWTLQELVSRCQTKNKMVPRQQT